MPNEAKSIPGCEADHGTHKRYRAGCRCDACRHAHVVYNERWQKANPEKTREYRRRYYQKHREQEAATKARWLAKHPEKSREYCQRWRSKESVREHLREYGRDYMLSRHPAGVVRGEWYAQGCVVCGVGGLGAMQAHHIDPKEKDFGISRLLDVETLRAELAKCVPVCANHHRMIHHHIKRGSTLDEAIESLREINAKAVKAQIENGL